MKNAFFLTWGMLGLALAGAASGDDITGLWSYRSLERPGHAAEPLVGLFIFHDGRFVHQAMHGGEPLSEQMADAHIGRYRITSAGVLQLDVETGIVVTPVGESLLAARSDTRHTVGFSRFGAELRLTYGNGSTELLERVESRVVDFIPLEYGMLTLTGEHFVLLSNPENSWIAGSGRYERAGDILRLHAWRWFEVIGGKAEYRADESFDAGFDGNVLRLPGGVKLGVGD